MGRWEVPPEKIWRRGEGDGSWKYMGGIPCPAHA